MSCFMSPVLQFPFQPQRSDESHQWQFDTEEAWNGAVYAWYEPRWTSTRWACIPVQSTIGAQSNIISNLYTGWVWAHRVGGMSERWQMFGQCLDQSSNPVANATVSMYDQTTLTQVDSQTSDNGGNYLVSSPYGAGRSFVVAYKPGSPDIAGTSQDNLP